MPILVNKYKQTGSALLLTVMIMAVLMTSTLSAIAVRFDQLASTEKISNASIAKIAADSGVARIKQILKTTTVPNEALDITDVVVTNPIDISTYKPNPRKPTVAYAKVPSNLPRCLAVAVLAPWVNGQGYLFSNNTNNPAMLFHYANIVNDTNLGRVGGGADTSFISDLTKVGSFYNPFAPEFTSPDTARYWTVRLGGPDDQFLTRKGVDGVSSYYKGLDFVYSPYLPRFVDSVLAHDKGTNMEKKTAKELRDTFEQTIRLNGFKIWLDASIDDATLYQYGLGDLFVDSNEYRLSWAQPSLWNDTPEIDNQGPYLASSTSGADLTWEKRPANLRITSGTSNDLSAYIAHGAKVDAFATAETGGGDYIPGAGVSVTLYGSKEGLRLNDKLTLTLLDAQYRPLNLESRTSDQGKLYNATLNTISTASGVTTLSIKLGAGTDTPNKSGGSNITPGDIGAIILSSLPEPTTQKSLNSVSLSATGALTTDVVVDSNTSPACDGSSVHCIAVGDVIQLRGGASGIVPVWGKVTSLTTSGTKVTSFTLDKVREMPLPGKNYASATFVNPKNSNPTVAYYGGESISNEYAGGDYSEFGDLWFYDLNAKSWLYVDAPGNPGRLAGAAMSKLTNSLSKDDLVMFGGMYHEYSNVGAPSMECSKDKSAQCLSTNQAGLRVAKRISNDAYRLTFDTVVAPGNWSWTKHNFDTAGGLANGDVHELRIVSTLAERSGLEGWKLMAASSNETVFKVTNQTTIKLLSVAGIAKGDAVIIRDTDGRIGWGNIETVNYENKEVVITPTGNTGGDWPTRRLSIEVVNRTPRLGSTTCTVVATHCTVSDLTGVAVGDQVVLENYNGSLLKKVLSGFISHIIGTDIYFTPSEDDNTYLYPNTSGDAKSRPVGRYGGVISTLEPANTSAVLFQGAATNTASHVYQTSVWKYDGTTWSLLEGDHPLPGGSNDKTVTTINRSTVKQVGLNNVTLLKDGTNIVTFDQKNDYLQKGSEVIFEQGVSGATGHGRRVFHGVVTGDIKNNGNTVEISHNNQYPNDTEFSGSNVVMTIVNSFNPDSKLTSTGTWDSAANAIQIGNNVENLASAGAIVGFSSPSDGYYIKVAGRTYASGFKLISEGRPVKGPLPQAYSTSTAVVVSNKTQLVSIGMNQVGDGGLEFKTDDAASPVWSLRDNVINATFNNRPFARTGGGISATGERLFVVAGGGYGEFTNGWKQTIGATSPWSFYKSFAKIFDPNDNNKSDLPNYFGGSLSAYDSATPKLAFFGGVQKFDGVGNDYDKQLGPKLLGRPDSSDAVDGSYSSLTNLTTESASFLTTMKNNSGSNKSLTFLDSHSFDACSLLGDDNTSCIGGQQLRNLGLLGRLSSTVSGGATWGQTLYINRVGLKFLEEGTNSPTTPSMILSGPVMSGSSTNSRSNQDGYYPFLKDDTTTSYGTAATNYPSKNDPANNKTRMLVSFAKLTDASGLGGSILVTTVGVGRAIAENRGAYPSGYENAYCASTVSDCSSSSYAIPWLPDSEDLLFTFNAAAVLSSADTYKVVGYYGAALRAYLVTVRKGEEPKVQEIVP